MGAVTYPDEMVKTMILSRFISCQMNTQEEINAEIVERYRQVWTPDIRILDPDGFELYRWNGFLPPAEFAAQLLTGEGQAHLRLHQEERAANCFEEALRRFPTAAAAPEAQYFLAVVRYKASHDGKDLLHGWRRLQLRYPDSTWRVRQSFSEQE